MTLIADIPGAKAAYVGSRPVWKAGQQLSPHGFFARCIGANPSQRVYVIELAEADRKYRFCFMPSNMEELADMLGFPMHSCFGISVQEDFLPNGFMLFMKGEELHENDYVLIKLRDAQETVRRQVPCRVEKVVKIDSETDEIVVSAPTATDFNPLYACNLALDMGLEAVVINGRQDGEKMHLTVPAGSATGEWKPNAKARLSYYVPKD